MKSWNRQSKKEKHKIGLLEGEIYTGGFSLTMSSSERGRFIERDGFSSIRATDPNPEFQNQRKKNWKWKWKYKQFSTLTVKQLKIETISETPTLQIDKPSVCFQREHPEKKIICTSPKQNNKWKPNSKRDNKFHQALQCGVYS